MLFDLEIPDKPIKDSSFNQCLWQLKKDGNGIMGKFTELLTNSDWKSSRCTMEWKGEYVKKNRFIFFLHTNYSDYLLRTPTCEGDAGKRGLGNMTCEEAKEKNRTITLSRQIKDWSRGNGLLPTPTVMDSSKDGDMKAAAKMMMGATHRASGQQLQKTLTDAVHIELLMENPELAKELANQPIMKRTNLPLQKEFVEWIRQTTPKELSTKTNLPFTKVEHWFRTNTYFSHPSIEDWNIIKPHLKDWENWEYQMTFQENKEWKGMLPTPRASESIERRNMKTIVDKVENGGDVTLTTLAKYKRALLLPTPATRDWNEGGNGADLNRSVGTGTGSSFQLNPKFVLEMMGFPTDFTQKPFNNVVV
jgi:hypothetical protein